MGTFGIDISNHQPNFDLADAARDGFEFAILKATEGSGFKDAYFARHLRLAREAGMTVAAYHYQRTDSVASQVQNIRSMVPLDVPVAIDVEDGSGGVNITRGIVAELVKLGYRVALTYLPRWYWNNIGRPDLSGLPPLWASDYRTDPDWSNYGGNVVVLRQFTSTPFDKNYFEGSRAALDALLNGSGESGGGGAAPDMLANEPVKSPVDGSVLANFNDTTWYTNKYVNELRRALDPLLADIADIKAKVSALTQPNPVDVEAVAELAKEKIAEDLSD